MESEAVVMEVAAINDTTTRPPAWGTRDWETAAWEATVKAAAVKPAARAVSALAGAASRIISKVRTERNILVFLNPPRMKRNGQPNLLACLL